MKSDPPTLHVLIVDDERHGRDVVRHMLKRHPEFIVVGEATNGLQAREEIQAKQPHLIFLDISMPKLSGMELAKSLQTGSPSVIVFVTAHDSYAVQAFERCAFDYLLKPFDQERFDQTIARVRERFRASHDADFGRRLREVLDQRPDAFPPPREPAKTGDVSSAVNAPERLTRFVIKESGRVFFVPVAATDWLEASGNYVGLHVGNKTHLIHEALAQVERLLDPRLFLRIHRSTIVNVERIKELQPMANGEFIVILRDGTRLKLSRSFRERANEVLGLT